MKSLACSSALSTFVLAALPAQEGPPGPAAELAKFQSLVGHWAGGGTAQFGPGAPPVKWTARGSYQWVMDGHFVQEDFEVAFDGQPVPMVFRAYLGWDRENGRYVSATIGNGGSVRLHEAHWLEDGTLLQLMHQRQAGLPYAERTRTRVEGGTMSLAIDLLMVDGPLLQTVAGKLGRAEKGYTADWTTAAFQGAEPAPDLTRLVRSAGDYEVEGAMVMAPGGPEIVIRGTDSFRPVFGGTVFFGATVGTAEGLPGEYRGDVFWGYDADRRCLHGVYVSNFGEVMAMDGWWAADGQLVSTFAGMLQGQPMAQRMLLSFDDKGHAKAAVADTMHGTGAPFRSFRAAYRRK
ncbi:MAG: DUF1579 family protein [Planctomycetes bacterium]|nr:DUF1579 family protein [Planctomycetota bacterium]